MNHIMAFKNAALGLTEIPTGVDIAFLYDIILKQLFKLKDLFKNLDSYLI